MGLTKPRAYQIYDIDYKQAVRVVTTTNITLSGGAPNAVDGVNLALNDRVLVTAQGTGSQNGLYYVTTLGSGSNGTWSRSVDGDMTGEIQAGLIVMVTEGTVYKDTQWKLITNDPIVIGVTPLDFVINSTTVYFANISAGGNVLTAAGNTTLTFEAGSGMSITGNTVSNTITFISTATGSSDSISNGTSNVTVVSSGGNVTVGVGGTGNVAVFATTGEYVSGELSASGNVTGANLITTGIIQGNTTISMTGNSIGIGYDSGNSTPENFSVAIGVNAGTNQESSAVAIGLTAGQTSQGLSAVAVGDGAGFNAQGAQAVAIGLSAGEQTQGASAVAIGEYAGQTTQGGSAIAIGVNAGQTSQTDNAIAIGLNAGSTAQGGFGIAIGYYAGSNTQGSESVAIGDGAGANTQGFGAVAIGLSAGAETQGESSVAIGRFAAGNTAQGTQSVAIGYYAGLDNQGSNAVAIGANAGTLNQPANSIIINASGTALNGTEAGLYVDPVRNDVANVANVMFYDSVSKELTYANTISLSGNISANVLTVNTSANIASVSAGNIAWSNTNGTFNMGMYNDVTLQVGQEQYYYLEAVANIANGQVVSWNGVSGNYVLGEPANAATPGFDLHQVLGIATQDITAGNRGYVTSFGKINGMNTDDFNVNDLLYLNPSVPGGLTNTLPVSPNPKVEVGLVIVKDPTNGVVQARVVAYQQLSELQDTNISAPANNQYLKYTTTGNLWNNANLSIADDPAPVLGGNLNGNGYAISTSGNITGNYFFGNGSQLTGIATTFPVADGTSNIDATTNGNVTISVGGTGNVAVFATTGEYITGLLSATGNIQGGNLRTAGQVSATSNITGGNLLTGGLISATGNITGGNVRGTNLTGNLTGADISVTGTIQANGWIFSPGYVYSTQYTGSANYLYAGTYVTAVGNIIGGNILTGGLISSTGNITGGNISATNHTGTNVSVTGTVTAASTVGGVITGTSTSVTGTQTAASTVGGVITGSSVSVTGTQTAASTVGGVITGTSLSTTGTATAGNLATGGTVSATGTITGSTLIGSAVSATGNITGARLFITDNAIVGAIDDNLNPSINVTYSLGNTTNRWKDLWLANSTLYMGDIALASNGNALTVNGANVLTGNTGSPFSTSGNITGGNLLTSGLISATGNITGNYFFGNGSQLTGVTASSVDANNLTGTTLNSGVVNSSLTSVGVLTSLSVSGNTTSGNISATNYTGTNVSVTGTATAASTVGGIITGSSASVSGNVTGGNITSAGLIKTTSNVQANNVVANVVAVSTSANITTGVTGELSWDVADGTLQFYMNGNIDQDIGQDQYYYAHAMSNITRGQVVAFSGVIDGMIMGEPANAQSTGFVSSYVMGVAVQDITANAMGYVASFGKVDGVNTNAFDVGDILYLDATTPGALTNVIPSAPNPKVQVAAVLTKSLTTGIIQVRPIGFPNLEQLRDVSATTPSNNQYLRFSTSSNVWSASNLAISNDTVPTLGGNLNANSFNISNVTNITAGNITLSGAGYSNATITQSNQLATKAYVDTATSTGLHIHEPVLVEAEGNLIATYANGGTTQTVDSITSNKTLTFTTSPALAVDSVITFTNSFNGITAGTAYFVATSNGTNQITISDVYQGPEITTLTNGTSLAQPSRANSGVGATLTNAGTQAALVLSGVTMAVNDRVLVYKQTTAYQNGVYVVSNIGSVSTNWVLTRSADTDSYAPQDTQSLGGGDYFFITGGTAAGESYVCSNDSVIVFGVTPITFTLFSAAPTYTGTSPVVVTGQVISLANTTGTGDFVVLQTSPTLITPNIGSATGTSVSTTGNITGANLVTAGNITATGNITGGNILSAANVSAVGYQGSTISVAGNVNTGDLYGAGIVSAVGNVIGGNITTVGQISATGNITSGNISATNHTGTNVSVTGTVTGGNLSTSGTVSATGNATAGNILTAGLISATGNITGNYIFGNGSQLTGITASGSSSKIFNGTSEANIGTSGGNANISIGGTSNVVVFATTGEYVTGLLSVTGNITGGNLSATSLTGTTVSVTGTVTAASTVGGVITGTSTSVTGSQTAASTVGGVITGSSVSVTGTATAASTVGGVITGSTISATGIIQTSFSTTATTPAMHLSGNILATNNDFGILQIGPGLTFNDTNIIQSSAANANSYVQMILQNQNSGTAASSDYVINNDTSGGTTIYGDFGINSTGFAQTASPFSDPSGTYVYAAGGNMSVGTIGANPLKFGTNDILRATIDGTTGVLSVVGNITSGNISATSLTGTVVSVTGTVTAASTVGGVITGSSVSVTGIATAASTVGGVITGSSVSVTGTATAASTVGGVITGSSVSVTGIATAASTVGGVITGTSTSVTGTTTAASVVGGVMTGTSLSVTGNVSSGNLILTGNANIAGNITTTGTNANLTLDPNGSGYVVFTAPTPVIIANSVVANTSSPLRLTGSVSAAASNIAQLQVGTALNFADINLISAMTASANTYVQMILQNQNAGSAASADFIVNNDTASGATVYGDFGINSTTFTTTSSPYTDANGTYLYAAGGNLAVGTLGSNTLKFAVNSTLAMSIATTGAVSVVGNLTAANVIAANVFYSGSGNRAPQITVGTSAPASPSIGDLWVDTN